MYSGLVQFLVLLLLVFLVVHYCCKHQHVDCDTPALRQVEPVPHLCLEAPHVAHAVTGAELVTMSIVHRVAGELGYHYSLRGEDGATDFEAVFQSPYVFSRRCTTLIKATETRSLLEKLTGGARVEVLVYEFLKSVYRQGLRLAAIEVHKEILRQFRGRKLVAVVLDGQVPRKLRPGDYYDAMMAHYSKEFPDVLFLVAGSHQSIERYKERSDVLFLEEYIQSVTGYSSLVQVHFIARDISGRITNQILNTFCDSSILTMSFNRLNGNIAGAEIADVFSMNIYSPLGKSPHDVNGFELMTREALVMVEGADTVKQRCWLESSEWIGKEENTEKLNRLFVD
jgi:hypothetical protein